MTVPRVANSLSDLAVGQRIMWLYCAIPNGPIHEGVITRLTSNGPRVDDTFRGPDAHNKTIVILADPPAPPDWLVPADAMAALREAVKPIHGYMGLDAAARALLDAAREVELP